MKYQSSRLLFGSSTNFPSKAATQRVSLRSLHPHTVHAASSDVEIKKSTSTSITRSNAITKSNTKNEVMVVKPLPRVLVLHTGGTLGMDADRSYEKEADGQIHLRQGTGGSYLSSKGLRPGHMLGNLLTTVPELSTLANLDLQVVFNKDSSNIGPPEWIKLARLLHKNREKFDAFLIIHGTDTMSYTAAALSFMLCGFRKPIVITGSQVPLAMPRSDARQNLIDSLTCAVAAHSPPHVSLSEVAICFGGKLLRGCRAQKVHSSTYQAFDSPSYPPLAQLGVEIEWNKKFLLQPEGVYRPRFDLDPHVVRVPIIPGSNPLVSYGDLASRGVHGIILEAFGVGNMPDKDNWLTWLKDQRRKGIAVYLRSQSSLGPLQPELYKSGLVALRMGVEAGPQMTPEASVVKMMLCLKHPSLPIGVPLAGEM